MKRTVFLVDSEKKGKAEQLLNENGITFSYDDRFHFDFRTAVVTAASLILLAIVIISIF